MKVYTFENLLNDLIGNDDMPKFYDTSYELMSMLYGNKELQEFVHFLDKNKNKLSKESLLDIYVNSLAKKDLLLEKNHFKFKVKTKINKLVKKYPADKIGFIVSHFYFYWLENKLYEKYFFKILKINEQIDGK